MGSGAHVRGGTILEEEASGAHTVGLKQTLLMPFVTLGSLINFCDCFMAGGTSRRDHSEVGSSYIHFNYTPNQDKATASLIGDVPRGVMLDRPPVFLGGQGGLVGPARITYGVVVGAGTIVRRDLLEEGRLVAGGAPDRPMDRPYDPPVYGDISRKVANCARYLGNVQALEAWYLQVRARFLEQTAHGRACLQGALDCLHTITAERLRRLDELAEKVAATLDSATGKARDSQQAFLDRRCAAPALHTCGRAAPPVVLAQEIETLAAQTPYLEAVGALSPAAKAAATAWLEGIVASSRDALLSA